MDKAQEVTPDMTQEATEYWKMLHPNKPLIPVGEINGILSIALKHKARDHGVGSEQVTNEPQYDNLLDTRVISDLGEAIDNAKKVQRLERQLAEREAVIESREFTLRGAEEMVWDAHRYLKRTLTHRGEEIIESLMLLAHCGFTIEKERAALRSRKEDK